MEDPIAPPPELLAVTLELMEADEEVRTSEVRLELARQYRMDCHVREQQIWASIKNW